MTSQLRLLFWPAVDSIFRWIILIRKWPQVSKRVGATGGVTLEMEKTTSAMHHLSYFVNIVRRTTMTSQLRLLFWPAVDSIFRWIILIRKWPFLASGLMGCMAPIFERLLVCRRMPCQLVIEIPSNGLHIVVIEVLCICCAKSHWIWLSQVCPPFTSFCSSNQLPMFALRVLANATLPGSALLALEPWQRQQHCQKTSRFLEWFAPSTIMCFIPMNSLFAQQCKNWRT